MKYKQVIVVRADLDMSPGKIAAQVAHAILRTKGIQTYEKPHEHTCIVCQVDTEEKLIMLAGISTAADLPYGLQRDEGRTEVEEGTYTALSIGPVSGEQLEALNKITKRLRLLAAR